jgi:hypothetical protein
MTLFPKINTGFATEFKILYTIFLTHRAFLSVLFFTAFQICPPPNMLCAYFGAVCRLNNQDIMDSVPQGPAKFWLNWSKRLLAAVGSQN